METFSNAMCRVVYALLGVAVSLGLATGGMVIHHEAELSSIGEQVRVLNRAHEDNTGQLRMMSVRLTEVSIGLARIEGKLDAALRDKKMANTGPAWWQAVGGEEF